MKAYKKAKVNVAVEKMRPKTAEQHLSRASLTQVIDSDLTEIELQGYVYRILDSRDIYDIDSQALFINQAYEVIETAPSTKISLFSFQSESELQSRESKNSFLNYSKPVQTSKSPNLDKCSSSAFYCTNEYSASVTQGTIFEAYVKSGKLDPEKDKKTALRKVVGENYELFRLEAIGPNSEATTGIPAVSRMINQNIYEDVIYDFRFWNDPSDSIKEPDDGTVLPLWELSGSSSGILIDAQWNPRILEQYITVSRESVSSSSSIISIVDIRDISTRNELNIECSITNVTFTNSGDVWATTKNQLGYISLSGGESVWSLDIKRRPIAINAPNDDSGFIVFENGILQRWVFANSVFVFEEETALSSKTALTFCKFERAENCKLLFCSERKVFTFNMKDNTLTQFEEFHEQPVRCGEWNMSNLNLFITFGEDWKIALWSCDVVQPIAVICSYSQVVDLKWIPYAPNKFMFLRRDGQVFLVYLDINL
eukprot:NODE_10_length_61504_cov_0.956502.p12 type:complete len:483 gc:universal NODE_10_length_61504_cov_0.956502:25242-23794(-)